MVVTACKFGRRSVGAAIGREATRLKQNLFAALEKQRSLAAEGASLSKVSDTSIVLA